MRRTGKSWLWPAPVLLCLLDKGLTLWGQPPAYWAGDYARAAEGNPITRWCLEQHPAAYAAESILWVALFCALIAALPWLRANPVSLGVALGHVVGSATWLWGWFDLYCFFPGFLLACSALIVWTWERADRAREAAPR